MFNVSFGEVCLIAVVGLIVIGPSRLPQTARFFGHMVSRVQRQVSSVKSEIRREMELEDLKNIQREYEESARQVKDDLTAHTADIQAETTKVVQAAQPAWPNPAGYIPDTDADADSNSIAGADTDTASNAITDANSGDAIADTDSSTPVTSPPPSPAAPLSGAHANTTEQSASPARAESETSPDDTKTPSSSSPAPTPRE